MKKIQLRVVVALLVGSCLFSSCIGSFSLFNKYAAWQKDMTDNKYINAIVGFFLMYRGRFNLANGDVFGLGFAVIGLVLSFFIFLFRKELSMREYRLCTAKRLVFLLAGVSAFLFTDYSHYADRFVTAYLLLIGVRFVLRILILVYYLRRRKLFRNGK